jgi:hypothetical protein
MELSKQQKLAVKLWASRVAEASTLDELKSIPLPHLPQNDYTQYFWDMYDEVIKNAVTGIKSGEDLNMMVDRLNNHNIDAMGPELANAFNIAAKSVVGMQAYRYQGELEGDEFSSYIREAVMSLDRLERMTFQAARDEANKVKEIATRERMLGELEDLEKEYATNPDMTLRDFEVRANNITGQES